MRKKLFIILFLASSLLPVTLAVSSTTYAFNPLNGPCANTEGITPTICNGNDSNLTPAQDPVYGILKTIIEILSVVVGVASVIVIIVQGLRIILSNGDSKTVESARNGIIYACVGVVIAILAQVIVAFVLTKFTT